MASQAFPHLSAPLSLKGVELRNRLVFQPHFNALANPGGTASEDLEAYYVERAWGGVGLIVDGGLAIHPEGKMCSRFVDAWDPKILPGYQHLTSAVHEHGAKIFGQLTHCGHTSLENPPSIMWAPTQMPEPHTNFTTKAMDTRDIQATVKGFATASATLLEAGFDGIEIKIAHDGLLRSFVSPFFNRRTDGYGGTFEGRMRLPLEVLAAMREATGNRCPLGVRLCLNEYTPFGYDLDYGLRVAEALEASGFIDYINCDAGTFSSLWMEIPPAAIEQGAFRDLNRRLRQQSSLPVVAFGRIKRPDLAEEILAAGEADLIGMARQLITDAETPRKIFEGRTEEIRACIGCNDACTHQTALCKPIRCVQNPAAGQERFLSERLIRKADAALHVVVVGGGPAGLKVAEIAARRGHRVTLLERNAQLGGLVRLAARQPLHEEVAEVIAYLEDAVERLGVEVWTNIEAASEEVLGLEPDVLVIATGSESSLTRCNGAESSDMPSAAGLHAKSPVTGLELSHVFSSDEVMNGVELPGPTVILVDGNGHWEAAGTAEFLAQAGYDIHMVTRRRTVAANLEETNYALFMQRAAQHCIRFRPFTELKAIEPDRVIITDVLTGQESEISSVNAVVPVYDRWSRDELYFLLAQHIDRNGGGPRLERVGDAAAPRLIEANLLEAHRLALTF